MLSPPVAWCVGKTSILATSTKTGSPLAFEMIEAMCKGCTEFSGVERISPDSRFRVTVRGGRRLRPTA